MGTVADPDLGTTTTVHTQYDPRGRATRVALTTQGVAATFQYGYDEVDRVARTTWPAPLNEQVTTTYDAVGRVASVCGTACYASGVQYSAVSQPTQQTDGNGVVERWTYDAARQWLTEHQVGTAASPSGVADRTYSYDAVGNVATITDPLTRPPSATQHFTYDARDRLQHAWTTNDPQGYDESDTYNAIGNLTNKGGTAYVYPAAGQAHPHAPSSVGGQTESYDLAGRLTTGGGRTLQWNAQNLPTSVTAGAGAVPLPPGTPNLTASRAGTATAGTPNLTASRAGSATAGTPTTFDPARAPNTTGVTESYTYDAAGARLSRTHEGMTTLYFGQWEADVQGSTVIATRAQYAGGSGVVAQRTVAGASNTVVYLHGDHLGSVSVATSSAGAVLDRQEYGPWGNIRSGSVSETSLNYTGQKRDGTGLLYYGARYYDPALGRFLSPDSIGTNIANPQSLNRYSYVGNNPLNHTDPSGHCRPDECDPEAGAGGGGTPGINGVLNGGDGGIEFAGSAGSNTDPTSTDRVDSNTCGRADCTVAIANLQQLGFNVVDPSTWQAQELTTLYNSFDTLRSLLGQTPDAFRNATLHVDPYGAIDLIRGQGDHSPRGNTAETTSHTDLLPGSMQMTFWDAAFADGQGGGITALHEIGHAWDFRTVDVNPSTGRVEIGALSRAMDRQANGDPTYPSTGTNITGSVQETFAESVAAYSFGEKLRDYDPNFRGSPRYDYLDNLLTSRRTVR